MRFGEENMYQFHLVRISLKLRPGNIPPTNAICMFDTVRPVLSNAILRVGVVL